MFAISVHSPPAGYRPALVAPAVENSAVTFISQYPARPSTGWAATASAVPPDSMTLSTVSVPKTPSIVDLAEEIARGTGARITVTADPKEAVSGVDFIHTDVWVSMGEAKDVWADRVRLLTPYQVNTALLDATGNSRVKFMHCLPAFHDPNTTVGREIMEHTGMTSGLEVTGEVFNSGASIVFDQAENRLHTIKAILVATLG